MGIKHTSVGFFQRCVANNLPDFVIGVVAIFIIAINIHYSYWSEPANVFRSDVISYYSYLPAAIVHNDLEFKFIEGRADDYNDKFWLLNTPINKPAILTTMGLSFLYLPFFIIAHIFALLFGFTADGFSSPYAFAIIFSSLFYVVVGLVFLKKVLLTYFDKKITSITLLLVVVATNLLYYTTFEAAFSHAYIFALISIFLYLIIRWYGNPTIKNTLLTGALSGLITLIRPTNILILLLFFLWNVKSLGDLSNRLMFFVRSWKLIVLLAFSFLTIWLPQLIYWKIMSGQFFFFTYGSINQSFFFNNPQIFNQLFSYRKGWFLYTPLMLIALAGFPILYNRIKPVFLPILVYLVAMIYVLASWWNWWFGGSFGARSYIDMYGILAIPLAVTLEFAFKKKHLLKYPLILVIVFFTGLNLFQTWQYQRAIIHFQSMNSESYWAVFLKTERPENFFHLIENPDSDKALKGIYTTIPKPEYMKITEDNCVEAIIFNIKNDSGTMKYMGEKAKARGISVEEMIQVDAKWLCDKKYRKKD